MPPKPKNVIEQLRSFCAYQERSRREVEMKMMQAKMDPTLQEIAMQVLVEEDFLNEKRFAHAYARGKFRIKAWGRNRIRQGLHAKGVEEDLIDEAIEAEIAVDEYMATLEAMIRKIIGDGLGVEEELKAKNGLLRKGFEWEEIQKAWKSVKEENQIIG
jgi:regulatory protein